MKLLSIDIKGLLAFQFSDIRRLQAEFSKDLQIIIGTNGSGKTHLLKQLGVSPPTRSDYKKNGYKELTFLHNNEIITLVSDFTNKTSPHKFFVGDPAISNNNLNVSGNTSIQEELLARYFNHNKFLDDILFNRLNLTQMRIGERKVFLMETNPSDIGFILNHQKKISSRIKGLNTTLSVMTNRKVELESLMLTEAQLKEYTDQKKVLEQKLTETVSTITQIETMLLTLPDSEITDQTPLRQDIVNTRIKLNKLFSLVRDIGKNHINENDNSFILKQKELETTIASINDQLEDIAFDKQSILDQLQSCTDDSVYKEHKLLLCRYDSIIKELENNTLTVPIGKNFLYLKDKVLEELSKLLEPFDSNQYQFFYTKNKRAIKESQIYSYRNKINILEETISDYNKQLSELEDIDKEKIPENPCSKSKCFLYVNYMSKLDKLLSRKTYLNNQLSYMNSKLSKYKFFYDRLEQQLQQIGDVLALVKPIFHLGNVTYPFLKDLFTEQVYTSLKTDNRYIYRKVYECFVKSENYYKLQETLAVREQEINKFSNKNILMVETKNKLQSDLEKIVSKFDKLNERSNKYKAELREVSSKIEVVREYRECVKLFNHYNDSVLPETLLLEEKKYHAALFKHMLSVLKPYQNNIVEQLGGISTILTKQNSIRDRYHNEILSQLDDVKKEKDDLTYINQALIQIPIEHTISYLNKIIEIMNIYMGMVFTYEFYIHAFTVNDTLDFKFKVQVEDVVVPDVSECSEAQSEMINIAFGLAIRTMLGFNDYPIYLDECGRTFDPTHKERLLLLLQHILDNNVVSQIFMVNHHAVIHEAFNNSETLVLNDNNILTPSTYNEHVVINAK